MSDGQVPEDIGRYRVVRLLGQGAMGRVLLAHDPVLDRDVALKLLRSDLGLPPEQVEALVERMRQEARASARVSHPNIVALHDMGDHPDHGLYLVFEYVGGPTLKERVEKKPFGPEAAAELAEQLGGALTTAHKTGVLHRDVKPDNVILSETGAKIADFGIARVPDSTLTRDGGLLGTPAYAAPEAIASGKFSALSDQFSMAATLYEALSGRRAFPGDDALTVATHIANDEPPKIAEVCGLNSHVDTVLARALAKNPRARFSSCEEFGKALAEALGVLPRSVLPTLPDEPPAVQERSKTPGLMLAALVGGALALAGASIWMSGAQKPARIRPVASAKTDPAPSSKAADDQPVAWLHERPRKSRKRRPFKGKRDAGRPGAPTASSPPPPPSSPQP